MLPVLDNLVFDRTAADVARRNEIAAKLRSGVATAEERAEYLAGMKGAYNYTDLNRVGAAVEYLTGLLYSLGYNVPENPGTDWKESDIQTPEQMKKYLGAIEALRNILIYEAPDPPADMIGLTFQEANDIEEILSILEIVIDKLMRVFVRSGVWWANSGGVFLYIPDQAYDWEVVPFPSLTGGLVYTGAPQSPDWGIDQEKYVITGNVGTDAGDYTATVKPAHGYKFPDESTGARDYSWNIQKAAGVISLPFTEYVITKKNWSSQVDTGYNGDGQITVQQDNQNVRVTAAGRFLNIMGAALGETRLTISASEGKNFLAAHAVSLLVKVEELIQVVPACGDRISGESTYYADIYR